MSAVAVSEITLWATTLRFPVIQGPADELAANQLLSHVVAEIHRRNDGPSGWLQTTLPSLPGTNGSDSTWRGTVRWLMANGFQLAGTIVELVTLGTAPTSASSAGEFSSNVVGRSHLGSDLRFDDVKMGELPQLGEIIRQTWHGTLDFPDLPRPADTSESLAAVVERYRRDSESDTRHWRIVRCRQSTAGADEVVGCLLLGELNGSLHITYLGVLPNHRGEGVGTAMVRFARVLSGGLGKRLLTTSVDSQNIPALRIYGRAGLVAHQEKRLFVRAEW